MKRKLITPPAVPAVTLANIKTHLRIETTDTDHDSRLTPYLTAAVNATEDLTGRALITQTWDLIFDSWSELVECDLLPFGNLKSVTHIKYQDDDDAEQTVTATDYLVDGIGTDEGSINFHSDSDFDFPDLWESDPITVRVVCGYGDADTDIPGAVQSAIKLMVSDMENGQDSSKAVAALLMPYRLWVM